MQKNFKFSSMQTFYYLVKYTYATGLTLVEIGVDKCAN